MQEASAQVNVGSKCGKERGVITGSARRRTQEASAKSMRQMWETTACSKRTKQLHERKAEAECRKRNAVATGLGRLAG